MTAAGGPVTDRAPSSASSSRLPCSLSRYRREHLAPLAQLCAVHSQLSAALHASVLDSKAAAELVSQAVSGAEVQTLTYD